MREDPFTDSSNLSIRLIRYSMEDDDKLTIKKVNEDIYTLYYTYATSKDEKHITILNRNQVLSYIESLLFLLSQHTTSFRFLQLNIPYLPLLLLPVQDLKKKQVQDAIREVCRVVYF